MQNIGGLLVEIRKFIELLDVNSELISSDYTFNYFLGQADGQLPGDKEKLLGSVDMAIDEWHKRGEPRHNPFMGSLNQKNRGKTDERDM